MADSTRVTIKDVYDLLGQTKTELRGELRDLREEVRADYISRAEFEPVKKLVYGTVGLILTAVVGAMVALVVQS